MEIGRSGRVQVEDIVFLVRKDAKKYARVKELLMMNEELKKARKAFDEGKFAGKNAIISIKNILLKPQKLLITRSSSNKIFNVEVLQIIIILLLQVMKSQTMEILVSLNNYQHFYIQFISICITQHVLILM